MENGPKLKSHLMNGNSNLHVINILHKEMIDLHIHKIKIKKRYQKNEKQM